MTTRRRIAVITGTRAEFGLLEPVLRALTEDSSLQTRLIVTGMHLLPRFGRTINHIRSAGWRVDAIVPMQTGVDSPDAEPPSLARGIAGIAEALSRFRSQVVVVLGDRIEAFAGASAAVTGRRILAHIHSGDRATGDVDDTLRNAISRMAHVHFAASQDAVRRLRRMGEEVERIFKVGAPGLDDIRALKASGPSILPINTSPPRAPYALIVQHPLNRGARQESVVMANLLTAVRANGLAGAMIYPNSDPGHQAIIRVIERWGRTAGWRVFRSLPRREYLCLAMGSALLVGNSSSGIIESASLGVNAVNVGPRQQDRLRCGPGVIDCGESQLQIRRAIAHALRTPKPRPTHSVYGDGRAGEHIARVLQQLRLTPELYRKRLTY